MNILVHEGRDVISMLPTGYGKSLIIELLPIACKEELSVDAFIIVIEPLNVIIEQQKKKTRKYILYLFTRKLNWVGYGAESAERIFMVEMEPNA